ncbi:heme ABC exporter ATP-binding protein CcmA [Zymomonas mobilis]|uniref:Heme exporter protein CcmA n=1 Tax=Zymomonas mobilis subsp. pomaceae (strain ATCC 29192 / DSM 22645 / JCM 10191 / CCUG 17912 / NBRC 13757 / NCIMB 11200 / NRRL B-4491 / Barker I) TaxID=579138 RepID=F8ESN7_ZYMMT|nr:heme ABC exporter ATP-binding protein CcmA [Zymomonas mobilis]AEI37812.1 heme exporter protein CcmA [Zymomonas mobilis subsp. pomaceae ATCC 29192]MDX5949179.1 heme ABC exporter ATP-binding protein CcmA [Zymomonas mobilis subsp. pomaceae]GEB89815.1 cytochrome c biogenesis ATP-binding export protein CcmA [Zymomonas mobilis subsp. pomaceae]
MAPISFQNTVLTCDNIACLRGDRLLFTHLSFQLKSGEVLMIKGSNGTGKTSLLRLLAGFLNPFSGKITRQGNIAFTDEALALDRDISLEKALAYWAALDGQRGAEKEAMDKMALLPLAQLPVRLLSTGQRKRAVLARLITAHAPIWLLDEPANGLDRLSVKRLLHVIQDHLEKGGIALIASHQALDLDPYPELSIEDFRPSLESQSIFWDLEPEISPS